MIQEVKNLRKSGVSWKRLEEFGLEYRYVALYLQNKISYDEMVENIINKSVQYAKRQMVWFRKYGNVIWVKNKRKAFSLASQFLQDKDKNKN